MKLPNGYGSVTKLSGKRRKPYLVRKTKGYHYDSEKDKVVQDIIVIGYAKTRAEGLDMLAAYNDQPFDLSTSTLTFAEIYEKWSAEKFPTVSSSSITAYKAAFKACEHLHDMRMTAIRLIDLQNTIDKAGKNYPTLKKIKILFNQLYEYCMKYEIVSKDYSRFVNIEKHRNLWKESNNDNKRFSIKEIALLWDFSDDPLCQTILMLIYTGLRVGEFLDLKKEDVHLEEQYLSVTHGKTENSIRKVPIADVVLPFFTAWYNDSGSEYLIHNKFGGKQTYDNYLDKFRAFIKPMGIGLSPHATRHTCISLLATAHVDQTIIKKIVGHSGSMTLTERVYTHLDVKELIDAVNQIEPLIPAAQKKEDATPNE